MRQATARKRGRPPKLSAEQILDAAEALPLREVSMRTVAQRLGAPPSSLYHHFPTRDALVMALAGRMFEQAKLPVFERNHWERWLVTVAGMLHDICVEIGFARFADMTSLTRQAVAAFSEPVLGHLEEIDIDDGQKAILWSAIINLAIGCALQTSLHLERTEEVEASKQQLLLDKDFRESFPRMTALLISGDFDNWRPMLEKQISMLCAGLKQSGRS